MTRSVRTVYVLATSKGNDVALEIAYTLTTGFKRLGTPCELRIDEPPVSDAGGLSLVVSPHEYFPLWLAPQLAPDVLDRARRCVFVLNVEQPGSPWFETAWLHARATRGVFDVSRAGVREFRRRGVAAVHAPLGSACAPEAVTLPALPDRPIDIAFLGHNSPRREAFFARHAAFFANRRCHIALTDVARPRRADTPGYLSGPSRDSLLGRTRILLNVHSTDRQYFESHRALLAFAHGCLLVTESSRDTEPLVAGRHFAMADLESLPDLCDRYLRRPDDLHALAAAGREFAGTAMRVEDTCRTLFDTMVRAAEPRNVAGEALERETLRQNVQARLTSALETRAAGGRDWTVSTSPTRSQATTPAVSVVVTVYNYEAFVGRCLRSVLASEAVPGGFEIVVVDDASQDGSSREVERHMDGSEIPVLLVRKQTNTGLADARNLGLAHARAPHVFILDADNWIYPSCLATLERSWVQGVAGMYGIIQRFDDDTDEGLGLLSAYDWSLRDLVRAPYIDAMALLDRAAVLDVGGYSPELIEHGWFGWEDYDLWLKLGQAGRECRIVPRILSAYRVHPRSMINRTNETSESLARHFERKFAGLAQRFPDLDRRFGYPVEADAQGTVAHTIVDQSPEALAVRCYQLEREVTDLRRSMSWRVTAPLRGVFRWITGRSA